MRWLLGLLGVLLGVVALTYGIQIGNLRSQINSRQAQIDELRSELAAVSAKAAGTHRDLITCADLQGMGLQNLGVINLFTDAAGQISASPEQQPVPLPQHCINQ